MTTGQLMFYAGIGLFGLTVILAIVFMIKKPKYRPENAVGGDGQTVPLRNGYPTEPVTARYDVTKGAADNGGGETELLPSGAGTVLLTGEVNSPADETQLLSPETELLPPETQLLSEETAVLK